MTAKASALTFVPIVMLARLPGFTAGAFTLLRRRPSEHLAGGHRFPLGRWKILLIGCCGLDVLQGDWSHSRRS